MKRLPRDELARLQPHFTNTQLEHGAVLHQQGGVIKHVYFPTSGMVSLLTVLQSGEAIETAIVGREGVVGSSVGTESRQSFVQALVQGQGAALRIESDDFLRAFKGSECLRTLVNRHEAAVLVQTQQTAACHAVHPVQARLCRWILHSQDTTASNTLVLTQEFLSHMLGVQRSSVSLCANALQHAGFIRYSRGKIDILDRAGLEDAACECYKVVRQQMAKLVPRPSRAN